MLFLNLSSEVADSFTSKYREVAEQQKGEGISFLIGDLEASQGAFQVRIFSFCHPTFASLSKCFFDMVNVL
jgi:hypothetical protein